MLRNVLYAVLNKFNLRGDDNGVDRLNYFWLTLVLGSFTTFAGIKQFVGDPIECVIPQEWEKFRIYVHNYCFVENTFVFEATAPGIPPVEKRRKRELYYYQWIPMIFMSQTIIVILPKIFWSKMSLRTGLSVRNIASESTNTNNTNDNEMDEAARNSAEVLSTMLHFNSLQKDFFFGMLPSSLRTCYMTIIYMVYKCLNCIVTLGQLYLMNKLLNSSYSLWGIGALHDLLIDRTWKESGHFPRVTFCDFMYRDITFGQPTNLIVQCFLKMNMVNEVMFIALWFLFFLVGIFNVVNLAAWILKLSMSSYTKRFINHYLVYREIKAEVKDVEKFIHKSLPTDAVTVLRLLETNLGHEYVSRVVAAMFTTWLSNDSNRIDIIYELEKHKVF